MPKKRGKKYMEAAKKIEAALAGNGNGGLSPEVACALAKETSISKFDATLEATRRRPRGPIVHGQQRTASRPGQHKPRLERAERDCRRQSDRGCPA